MELLTGGVGLPLTLPSALGIHFLLFSLDMQVYSQPYCILLHVFSECPWEACSLMKGKGRGVDLREREGRVGGRIGRGNCGEKVLKTKNEK